MLTSLWAYNYYDVWGTFVYCGVPPPYFSGYFSEIFLFYFNYVVFRKYILYDFSPFILILWSKISSVLVNILRALKKNVHSAVVRWCVL